MRRLQRRDGTSRHLRHAGYHSSFCLHRQKEPFFLQLAQEIDAVRSDLLKKSRMTEDEEDKLTARSADVNFTEIALEDVIRDILSDVEKLERQSPELNIKQKTFPNGLNAIINPEGESQIKPAQELRRNLKEFSANEIVAALINKLDNALDAFSKALSQRDEQLKKVEEAVDEEQKAKTAVREQLGAAYGRLLERFKAKPKLTERYFYQEKVAEKSEAIDLTDKIEALFLVLNARKIARSEEQNATLQAPKDEATLTRWIEKAAAATKIEELFS